jgi:hypothetical protein
MKEKNMGYKIQKYAKIKESEKEKMKCMSANKS